MGPHHTKDGAASGTGDAEAVKRFYDEAFGWRFIDVDLNYAALEDGRVEGAFGQDPAAAPERPFGVMFSEDLEASLARVQRAGGTVTQAIETFSGGRRFRFRDPSGTEMAVWSDR